MIRVLGIDPGKRALAWAVIGQERPGSPIDPLAWGLTKGGGEDWADALRLEVLDVRRSVERPPHLVVVEMPRIYPQDRQRRPNDILDLTFAAGACAGIFPGVRLQVVWPRTWKGQAPKQVVFDRTWGSLRVDGLEAPRNHNIRDALGIALWGLRHGGLR